MLQTIRDRASGWIAYIIIGLLIIPFALWGINQYFSGSAALDAAQVGKVNISLQEFQRTYQQRQRQFPQLDAGTLKVLVLQQMVNEQLLLQAADRLGLRVGDRQLSETIRSITPFQENGVFSTERYKQALRSQGLTEAAFEESLRRSQTVAQLQQGLTNSAIMTPAELNRLIELMNQKRELEYLELPLTKYLEKTAVDESAIETYYQENKAHLLSTEQVQIDYVELTLDQIAADIGVSEDDLQEAYREQIAKYTQPEERGASHILVTLPTGASDEDVNKAQAKAQAIHDEIASGAKTFDQALQEAEKSDAQGIQGGSLGVIRKGMFAEPAFESALYELKQVGDISEPVRSSFGFHIIRLDAVTPERVKSFAEVREELAKELRQQRAEPRFYEETESLANLSHEHPDTLKPAAEALKLKVEQSPWFSRSGGEGVAAYPKVVEAAFSEDVLKRGYNSEPIEVEPNHVIVIRVQAHKEAAPLTLQEAREEIVSRLRNAKAKEALEKDTEILLKRTSSGESLETLAKEFGGEFKQAGLVGRSDNAVESTVLDKAFQLAKPDSGKLSLGSVALSNGNHAVLAVSRVEAGKPSDTQEAERKALLAQLTAQIGATEFQGFVAALREQTRIETYPDRL